MRQEKCPAMAKFPKGKGPRALAIAEKLSALYPDAACALDFQCDPFRLLVMARLSAQCTDKRVNEVSVALFEKYPDVRAFAQAEISELEEAVRPCGLFRTKAAQIKKASLILLEQYGGKVPADKESLMALPGVGEKIANLMLGDVFGDPHIVADTHLIRLMGRFGLVDSTDPGKVTRQMEKLIPKAEQSDFCHRAILLGRGCCKAQRPDCDHCPLNQNTATL